MNWLTIITTLIAALAPSLVSIITIVSQTKNNQENNKHELEVIRLNNESKIKLKRLEDYYSKKDLALSNYLDNLNNYLLDQSLKNLNKYNSSFVNVSRYISAETFKTIFDIDMLIKGKKFDMVKITYLNSLAQHLNAETREYQ